MALSRAEIADFRAAVYGYYNGSKREMPWRTRTSGYYVLVSELMLQQTGVERVKPKFEAFVTQFVDFEALASAPLSAVIAAWSGLGYNRRAKYLHAAARIVRAKYGGELPEDVKLLQDLPGVGPNTAGAIMAYAFNRSVVYLETNIRTVYMHHFFVQGEAKIDDKELRPLVEQTLDADHPREWYWALMDYGTYLKSHQGNNIARSKHYKKQSTFAGSPRQMRGEILRRLQTGAVAEQQLATALAADDRYEAALASLIRDGLVERRRGSVGLPSGLH